MPDAITTPNEFTEQDALKSFAALVMADAGLAAHLAAIDDGAAFVSEVRRCAGARGIVLRENLLQNAWRPDLLGLSRWSDPLIAGSPPPPRDWLPIAVTAQPGAICVDWARLGAASLRAAFYEESIRGALALPFNRLFRYSTLFCDLIAQAEAADNPTPRGFIFHMSRCGSTLVAQMLAALPGSVVISEAAPIDTVVQLARSLSEDDAVRALRAIVAAFGRRCSRQDKRFFVKLDCWHTLALPLFRRAFPSVPWIFLYRDPVEVLVSQMRQRGMQMVPQYLPPRLYGIPESEVTLDEDYCARVLAAVCQAVIDHHDIPAPDLNGGLVLNYRELPEAVYSAILPHFRVSCSAAERECMRQATQRDIKSPGLPFAGDAEEKQRAATANIHRAAEQHLGAIYRRLEAMAAAFPLS